MRFALCLSSDSCNRFQTNNLFILTEGNPIAGSSRMDFAKTNGRVDELILLPVYLNVKSIIEIDVYA